MRAFSEIIASFKRSGPFPIESDYIFENEARLKDYYETPEEKAILHKGLLKVVEDDGEGNQALYWVTKKKTNDELEFTKLVASNNGETISDLLTRLDQEVKDRINADDAIWGTKDHTSVPDDLNSLKDIAEEIAKIRKSLDGLNESTSSLQEELDNTQVGAGLNEDGSYTPKSDAHFISKTVSITDALAVLDDMLNKSFFYRLLGTEETPSLKLDIDRQITGTTISGEVKVSTSDGNGIITKNDGLFYKLATEYVDGVLTIKVNDNIIGVHTIGLSAIVDTAVYDPDTEELVIVFKLLTGDKQTVRIPVGTLIREWEVDNSIPDKVVELEKTIAMGTGADKLSADVRIFQSKDNILVKNGNSLYVKGTSDNITHNSESLDSVIDGVKTSISTHVNDFNNPHRLTAAQIGAISSAEVQILLKSKADLINGKLPIEQLPDGLLNWIDVDDEPTTEETR